MKPQSAPSKPDYLRDPVPDATIWHIAYLAQTASQADGLSPAPLHITAYGATLFLGCAFSSRHLRVSPRRPGHGKFLFDDETPEQTAALKARVRTMRRDAIAATMLHSAPHAAFFLANTQEDGPRLQPLANHFVAAVQSMGFTASQISADQIRSGALVKGLNLASTPAYFSVVAFGVTAADTPTFVDPTTPPDCAQFVWHT